MIGKEWGSVFREFFGIFNEDFSNLIIPDHSGKFKDAIIIPNGITGHRLFQKCRELFCCDVCIDLEDFNFDNIVTSKRPKISYAVRIPNLPEIHCVCDDCNCVEFSNRAKIVGITLPEYLAYIIRAIYSGWKIEGRIDVICAGSILVGNRIPVVRFDGKKMFIYWINGQSILNNRFARSVKVIL